MKYISIFLSTLLFTSCTSNIASIGIIGIIAIFAIMLILFVIMFYLIAKRKKQGEKSLVKFNNDIHNILKKVDSPEGKVEVLNTLIERINNDEKYKKDTDWRNKVLAKTYMHLATAYYQMGNEMQTLTTCSKIIELDSEDGMAYYNRGSIYSNMGMYDKALQDLNRTVELLPDYASAYNNRGLVHQKMEHYQEALSDFDHAVRLENSPIAYYNRGNTHFETDNFQEALDNYEIALSALDNSTQQKDLKSEIETNLKLAKEKIIRLQK